MLRVDWVDIARELGTNRTALQCLKRFVLEPGAAHGGPTKARKRPAIANQPAKGKEVQPGERSTGQIWTKEEDKHLLEGVQRHGMRSWPEVALHLNSVMSGTLGYIARTPNQCSFRYSKSLCPTIKKGRWSAEEDEALRKGVAAFGRTWIKVQEYVEGRTDAQCRERWSNMLDPSLKTGPWEAEEDRILLDAAGRKLPWSAVSALLPGRTDNRCAKRYQILIKEQAPGQANAPTPGTKKSQKRSKKQKDDAVREESEVADAGVVNPGGQTSPSTGTTPDPTTIANEIPTSDVTVGSTPKPRRKPKVKARVEEQSSVEPIGSNSLDAAIGDVEAEEQGGGDALRTATTKTTKAAKEPKEPKEAKDKTPSAYQLFMKDRLPEYKAENPGVPHKDAFKNVALEWKDSDRNPNKGAAPKAKKEPKPKADKDAEPKKSKKKPAKKASASSEAEEEEEAADDDDASSN
ncbi:Myb-like DNA-binding domain protein [Ceratobasidium sp. 392]|nr:Myb-like DNA-binding domain protein [Ceratobasidium sp. 392]